MWEDGDKENREPTAPGAELHNISHLSPQTLTRTLVLVANGNPILYLHAGFATRQSSVSFLFTSH